MANEKVNLEELDKQEAEIKLENKILKKEKCIYRYAVQKNVLFQLGLASMIAFYYWLVGISFFFIVLLFMFLMLGVEYKYKLSEFFMIKDTVDKVLVKNKQALEKIEKLRNEEH